MHQPTSSRKQVTTFEAIDPDNPIISETEIIDDIDQGKIVQTQIQRVRYLSSGEPITSNTQLFRTADGNLTTLDATYVCSSCFTRHPLTRLGKHIPEQRATLCEQCKRHRKHLFSSIKNVCYM
jgi:hypothetical protein